MNFNPRFGVNSESGSGQTQPNSQTNRSSNSGLNFEFPSINFDFNSLTQALNPRNFNIANNWDDFIGSAKSVNRSKDMVCQSCLSKFTVFKRKRTCFDCNMDFCKDCLNRDITYDRRNHCKRCHVFTSVPMDRNALNGLRARDLKWYLASKRIPSQMCNEKGELVDLILESVSPQTNSSNSSEYLRRFGNYNTTDTRNEGIGSQPQTPNLTPNPTPNQTPIRTPTQTPTQTNSDTDWPNHENENISVNPLVNPINTNSSETTDTLSHSESNDRLKELNPNADNSNTYFNVDDIVEEEQLKKLNVKQLKLILTRNFIDYKGCVEKEELLVKVERLWKDRHQNKALNVDEISDSNICKICMEWPIDCVLLECGHMISCTNCGKRLNECPICRQYVTRVVHIFKS